MADDRHHLPASSNPQNESTSLIDSENPRGNKKYVSIEIVDDPVSSREKLWRSGSMIDLLKIDIDDMHKENPTVKSRLLTGLGKFPGLLIATILNLFLSISFGQAFFPSSWTFPDGIPRAIGVQMFLLSTTICQIFMTSMSEFPTAQGMMMVENIPFMHTIANIAIQNQGMGRETFATVFIAFALSSIIVGIFFLILGIFRLGNIVYFFPKHVIIGCIGGIGIFLILTSIEVSTNISWEWSLHTLRLLFHPHTYPLLLTTFTFEFILSLILYFTKLSLLPPFYFVSITPIFYIILLLCRIDFSIAHDMGWFFPTQQSADFWLIWDLIDFRSINWSTIGQLTPTIISLTVFSLMHVPINIPSLSMSTKQDVEMNKELIAHGVSNIVTGCIGGLQNYLCYSNSVLYFKCNGGGKISGYLLAMLTAMFFFIGPSAVHLVPRCMAGCILLHIGIELTREALVDSLHAFDMFEYLTVWLITLVMTVYGMTAGLGVGILCAAVTFTLQAGKHVPPVRRQYRASALRSSQWRNPGAAKVLESHSKHILVLMLQGEIFFANATILRSEISHILSKTGCGSGKSNGSSGNGGNDDDVWYLLLDFTQVLGIDSSAAETLAKIYDVCRPYDTKLCYSRGSVQGFPCVAPLSENLSKLKNETLSYKMRVLQDRNSFGVQVHVADSLDQALQWCEDDLIYSTAPTLHPEDPYNSLTDVQLQPVYLRQFHSLCGDESPAIVTQLLSYFVEEDIPAHTVLWKQGGESNRAVLLADGRMNSFVENEEDTTTEEVLIGGLIGEFGLLTNTVRRSTVVALEDSRTFILYQKAYEEMTRKDPYLTFVLSRICMAYLDHRVQHVANRMWGSHTLETVELFCPMNFEILPAATAVIKRIQGRLMIGRNDNKLYCGLKVKCHNPSGFRYSYRLLRYKSANATLTHTMQEQNLSKSYPSKFVIEPVENEEGNSHLTRGFAATYIVCKPLIDPFTLNETPRNQ
eukprot:gene3001-5879_t